MLSLLRAGRAAFMVRIPPMRTVPRLNGVHSGCDGFAYARVCMPHIIIVVACLPRFMDGLFLLYSSLTCMHSSCLALSTVNDRLLRLF